MLSPSGYQSGFAIPCQGGYKAESSDCSLIEFVNQSLANNTYRWRTIRDDCTVGMNSFVYNKASDIGIVPESYQAVQGELAVL